MSYQLTCFVNPITGPLENLQRQISQLASLHREAHTRLRSQGTSLTGANASEAFIGDAGAAFSAIIDHYINVSEKHMQLLDEAVSNAGTCINEIAGANGTAASAGLNEQMVTHILSNLHHDDLIRDGGSAVQQIVDDMGRRLNDMKNTAGGLWDHLKHFDIGGAIHDVTHEIGDLAHLAGDALDFAISVLEHVGQVLIQWGAKICEVVGNCLKTVGSLIAKAGDFVLGISDMIGNIKVIFDPHASLKDRLLALGGLAFDVVSDVSMVTGAGELMRAGKLLFKGGEYIGKRLLKGGGFDEWWKATNLGPNHLGTLVPKSFDLEVGGEKFFVHPNVTEHFAEYVRGAMKNGISSSGEFPFSSFAGAVEKAQSQGLKTGKNFFDKIGPWQLGIDKNGNVIYHGLYRP